jgi:hypothetical protein
MRDVLDLEMLNQSSQNNIALCVSLQGRTYGRMTIVAWRPLILLHEDNISTHLAYDKDKICYYVQRYESGTQAILSPCVVRTQHGKDCSQLTGNLISLTLPHSYPLNTSHPGDDDATGIFDMLHYNSRVASLSSQCLTLDRSHNDVAISTL